MAQTFIVYTRVSTQRQGENGVSLQEQQRAIQTYATNHNLHVSAWHEELQIIDKQFLDTPWYGSRQMARHMQRHGHKCGRQRVRRVPRENDSLDHFRNLVTASYAIGANLSDAKHQQKASAAQDLSLSAARVDD